MLAGPILAVGGFLADGNSPSDVDPTTGHGPEWGKAGPTGLLTVVLLCVALYFLVKSMNRNLKKVPASFDAPKVAVGAGSAGSTTASGTVDQGVVTPGDSGAAPAPPGGPDASGSGGPAQ